MKPGRVLVPALLALVAACTMTASPADAAAQCGKAAWYDLHGLTATGEASDASILAAAHRTLPFGTRVKVENLGNGRAVIVRINDRGPFVAGRVIDLTRAAAERLGYIGAGVAEVRVTVVDGDASALPGNCREAATTVAAITDEVPDPKLRPAPAVVTTEVAAPAPAVLSPQPVAGQEPMPPADSTLATQPAPPMETIPMSQSLALRFEDAFEPGEPLEQRFEQAFKPSKTVIMELPALGYASASER